MLKLFALVTPSVDYIFDIISSFASLMGCSDVLDRKLKLSIMLGLSVLDFL